jgi:phosphoglycerate kinase
MDRLTIGDVDLTGKKVLCRVDFNVPIKEGKITDDTRIQAALPTIQALSGSVLALSSHLGRPKGKVDPAQSLVPCAARLSELLGKPVKFLDDCVGDAVAAAVASARPGDVLLLENTRFHAEEECKKEDSRRPFAEQMAAPFEAYVNDAFGSSHRKHASVYDMAALLTPAVAGLLMEKEVAALHKLLLQPQEGFVALLAGAKMDDKIGVLRTLLGKCEKVLVGGAMAWAFFKARHYDIGVSLSTPESLAAAKELLDDKSLPFSRMFLPTDCVMRFRWGSGKQRKQVPVTMIRPGWSAVDIGPDTVASYVEQIKTAKALFWNGPMGLFEVPPFDEGTFAVARAVADCPGYTVVGGGDSIAALEQAGVADKIDHISTGGGASLEFIEFGGLPGIEALNAA